MTWIQANVYRRVGGGEGGGALRKNNMINIMSVLCFIDSVYTLVFRTSDERASGL